MNYINLDMAGVNWPGGGGAPHGDPDPQIDEEGYPKDSEVWPLRVYIGPGPNHDRMDQPEMVGISNWIGSDALGLEEQLGTLVGTNYSVDTLENGRVVGYGQPEGSCTKTLQRGVTMLALQDNLGTVTVGFGGWWMVIGVITKYVTPWKRWKIGWIRLGKVTVMKIQESLTS